MVFDENLRARLLAFQQATGLSTDGEVGAKTWTKLVELPAQVQPKTEPTSETGAQKPAPVAVDLAEYPVLFDLATRCQTEEGVKEYLRTELGFDVDEALRNIASVLDEG